MIDVEQMEFKKDLGMMASLSVKKKEKKKKDETIGKKW